MCKSIQTYYVYYSSSLNLNYCPEDRGFFSSGLMVLVQAWVTTDKATVLFFVS